MKGKWKAADIERLAARVGVDGLHYENIREREEQLQRAGRWPMFSEIIEAMDRTGSAKQRPDYLKITR